jgi:hypothetical protein
MLQTIVRDQDRRAKPDAWNTGIEQLEIALAADLPGREREWAESMNNAAATVELALRRHRALGRDENGMFAEVDETRPTLARQADQLRQGHDGLLELCLALRDELRRAQEAFTLTQTAFPQSSATPRPAAAGGVPDFGAIRRQAEELLERMRASGQAEDQLVLESVNTDIGVGD